MLVDTHVLFTCGAIGGDSCDAAALDSVAQLNAGSQGGWCAGRQQSDQLSSKRDTHPFSLSPCHLKDHQSNSEGQPPTMYSEDEG